MPTCTKCGIDKPSEDFYKRKQVKSGIQSHCKSCVDIWRKKVYDIKPGVKKRANEASRKCYAKQRAELIVAYGGKCTCCGESEPKFLTIDHIDGSGSEHRKVIGEGGVLTKFLRKHGYPKDNYRLLCFNCNCCLGFFGVCPHETARQLLAA